MWSTRGLPTQRLIRRMIFCRRDQYPCSEPLESSPSSLRVVQQSVILGLLHGRLLPTPSGGQPGSVRGAENWSEEFLPCLLCLTEKTGGPPVRFRFDSGFES